MRGSGIFKIYLFSHAKLLMVESGITSLRFQVCFHLVIMSDDSDRKSAAVLLHCHVLSCKALLRAFSVI